VARRRRDEEVSRDTPWDEDAAADAREQERYNLRVQVEQEILKKVLETWEGRRVLYRILARGDIYQMEGMPFESERAQRKIGRQQMAVEVLSELLQVDPEVYILMQREGSKFEHEFAIRAANELGDEDGG